MGTQETLALLNAMVDELVARANSLKSSNATIVHDIDVVNRSLADIRNRVDSERDSIDEQLVALAALRLAIAQALSAAEPPAPEPPAPEPPAPEPPAPEPPAPEPPAPEPPPPPPPPPQIHPAVLQTLELGDSGPMISSRSPDSGEEGTYSRRPFNGSVNWQVRTFNWEWVVCQSSTPGRTPPAEGLMPRMRLIDGNDGQPLTEWVQPVNRRAMFTLSDVANGHHLAVPELEGIPHCPLAQPFLVNDTGTPLPDEMQTPWTSMTRFEVDNKHKRNFAVRMQAPTHMPTPTSRPPVVREILPVTERLTASNTWSASPVATFAHHMCPVWVKLFTGDKAIERDQNYFHGTAVAEFPDPAVGPDPIHAHVRSGPRYVGKLGIVADMLIRPGGSIYALDVHGRFYLIKNDGYVLNEGGMDLAPDAWKYHAGVLSLQSQYFHDKPRRAAEIAQYRSAFRMFGNWDQVPGPKFMWEPWGFCVAMRRPDGSITYEDGHDIWIADTLNHRMLFLDHWTAHSAAGFQPAHLPPSNYIQAPGPTGESTFCLLAGSVDGLPTYGFNEPWKPRFNPFDGHIYYANYGDGSIWRLSTDGAVLEPVIQTAVPYDNAGIGIPNRLGRSSMSPASARTKFLRDGQVGVASCTWPTAVDFDSQGRLLWIENYTYAIRRLDMTTGEVVTVCHLLDKNGGSSSSGNNEPNLVVDRAGTWGAVDDIFCNAWANGTDKRFSKDGVLIGKWSFVGGSQQAIVGPRNTMIDISNYSWGFTVGHGKLASSGNASGSQFGVYSKKLPTDPVMNQALFQQGQDAWDGAGFPAAVLGPDGQGSLGLPNLEDLTLMSTEELHSFLRGVFVPEAKLAAVEYYLRWNAQNFAALPV